MHYAITDKILQLFPMRIGIDIPVPLRYNRINKNLGGQNSINFLEERIVKDGVVKAGNILKVDSFLNHQMDVRLFRQMGEEFKRRFADKPINKILTIEASGIGIAIEKGSSPAARKFTRWATRSNRSPLWKAWTTQPARSFSVHSHKRSFV